MNCIFTLIGEDWLLQTIGFTLETLLVRLLGFLKPGTHGLPGLDSASGPGMGFGLGYGWRICCDVWVAEGRNSWVTIGLEAIRGDDITLDFIVY
jgi:hypothetical protein